MTRIAFCQCTFERDYGLTKFYLKEALPYVDVAVIVEDGVPQAYRELREIDPNKVRVYSFPFGDDSVGFRNHSLELARYHKADWVIWCDPDERFERRFWEEIRKFIDNAGENNQLSVLGYLFTESGEREFQGYKSLVFKLYPGVNFTGSGPMKNVHERWPNDSPYTPEKTWRLPDRLYYFHTKSNLCVMESCARDVYLAGGGDGVGEKNPLWKPLLKACDEETIDSWEEFRKKIQDKTYAITPVLGQWVLAALTLSASDWGKETRGAAKWILYYHPELAMNPEIQKALSSEVKESYEDTIDDFVVETYRQVLGREPDPDGRRYYRDAILRGQVLKEDLPRIFRASDEYRIKKEKEPLEGF